MTVKTGFLPVVSHDTRVLILGTLPGDASLRAGRYYANPANQFWKLIGTVIEADLQSRVYEDRLEVLRAAGVGLWDAAHSAIRPGSLDQALREVRPNDLAGLALKLIELRAVGFNGAKPFQLGAASFTGMPSLRLIQLPSSSPANGRMRFEAKAAAWAALRPFLRR